MNETPLAPAASGDPGDDAGKDAPATAKRKRVRRTPLAEGDPASVDVAQGAIDPDTPAQPAAPPRRRRTVAAAAQTQASQVEPSVAEPSRSAPVVVIAHVDAPVMPPAPDRNIAAADAAPVADVGIPEAASVTAAPGEPRVRDEDEGPRGRRRNRRDRKRRDRAEGHADSTLDGTPGADADAEAAPRVQAALAQAGALFAQVLSGAFDADEGTPSEAGAGLETGADVPAAASAGAAAEFAMAPAGTPRVDAHKRVLAAEPEAPKLHKVLAQAGIGSRRDMEDMILDGRITVNDEPAHVGQRISFGDQIKVNGKPVKVRIMPPPARLIAYHKPVGEIVTHDDPQNRPTVYRRLPRLAQGKWQSVGRLDINTEGLLLFTNSGELAHQLMHPRFGVEREYAVRVLGTLQAEAKARLLAGVEIEGQMANLRAIDEGGGEGVNRWYRVVIAEGRNREVRKLFDSVGLTVNRLIRIRYGSVVLPHGLKRGGWVDLDENEVRAVRRLAGGERGARPEQAAGRGPDRGGHASKPRNERGAGHADRYRDQPRDPARGRPPPSHASKAQAEPAPGFDRGPDSEIDSEQDFDPRNIPNPLEQTFDKRFVQNPRSPAGGRGFGRGGGGFGAGGSASTPAGPQRGTGPKEPDPLQTSVGFIGADAYHRKSKGGRGGGSGGGGGGGGRRGR
jgi:23S rRNA pseudouridine2605 synthase